MKAQPKNHRSIVIQPSATNKAEKTTNDKENG
jgi:hypothetical protein